MAHSFDTKYQIPVVTGSGVTGTTVTASYTCGAGATVLVLGIGTAGTTNRAGGTPTYNGRFFLDSGYGSVKYSSSPEAIAEMWYMLNPPTGSAYTIAIPNSGGANIRLIASSYKATAGSGSIADYSGSATGLSANPSLSISGSANGVAINMLVDGLNTAPTANGGTLLYKNDDGAYSRNAQYYLLSGSGARTLSWTASSDDWASVGMSFKDGPAPSGIALRGTSWNHAEGVDTTTITTTLTGVASGSLIIANIGGGVVGGIPTCTVTDSRGNSYGQLETQTVTGGGYNYTGFVHYAIASSSGDTILTWSYSEAQQYVRAGASEYSGVNRTNPIGGHKSAFSNTAAGGSTDGVTTGLFAVTGSDSLIWCAGYSVDTIPTITPGTGYTKTMDLSPYTEVMVEERLLSGTTGSIAGTMTFSANAYYAIYAVELMKAVVTSSYSVSMVGGGVAGGTATLANGKIYSLTAGGVAGGSATIAFTKTTSISAAGGALAGGSATIAFTKTTSINGAGGAIAGYSASVASGRVVTSSAGAVAGSSATVAFTKTMAVSATAGGVVGGNATIAFNRDYTYPYFFLDYFDRANETPLASPWGSLSTFNQFNLSSNQATAGAGNSVSVYNNLSGSSYYVSWNYLNNPSYGGVVILASGSNGYAIAPEIPYPGTHYSMNVYRINGTTLSSIGSWSSVYPTGGALPGCFLQVRSEVGSNNVLLTLWVGGTRIGNVTVSEFTVGAGKVGLFSNASTALDIFEVGGLYAGGLAGGSADVTFTKTVAVNGTGGAIAGGAATIQTTGLQTYTVSGVGGAVAGYSSSLAVGRVEVGVAGAVGGGSSLVELTKTYSYSAVGGAIAGYAATLAAGRVEVGVAGSVAGGSADVQIGSTQTYEMSATGGAIAGYQATLELGRAYSGIGGSLAGGTADKAVSRNLDVTMASGAVAGFAALYTFGRSEVTTAGAIAGGAGTFALGRVEDIEGGAVTGGTSDVSFLSIFGSSSTKGIGVELPQRRLGIHCEERVFGKTVSRSLGAWAAYREFGAAPERIFGAYNE